MSIEFGVILLAFVCVHACGAGWVCVGECARHVRRRKGAGEGRFPLRVDRVAVPRAGVPGSLGRDCSARVGGDLSSPLVVGKEVAAMRLASRCVCVYVCVCVAA